MRQLPNFTHRWTSPQFCWACAHLPNRKTSPAQFAWTTDSGTEYPLCGECCMRWRRYRAASKKDLPQRIRGLI